MFRWALALIGAFTALGAAAVHADFTPVAGFDRQIFPSYIIATASLRGTPAAEAGVLGDPRGLLGAEVVAPSDGAAVRVQVSCDQVLEPSEFVCVLPKAGETYRVCPYVKYRYEALSGWSQAMPVNVTIRVKLGDAVEEEQTVTCTARAINDCPFALAKGEGVLDVSYAFAAYVNEQHPFVDKLLREALDVGIVRGFDGYQSDPVGVVLQAYALWDLLVRRDMRYSSITTSAARSDAVGSQHVRLIEESINNAQANCVDGSVLWASLLQKIGVDSFLVLEPGHCYAGFYLDKNHERLLAIETTLLGTEVNLDDLTIADDLAAAIPEDVRDDWSFPSFIAAVQSATAKLTASHHGAETSQQESEGEQDDGATEPVVPAYKIIDVAEARRLGILPIAFQNREEFVWYDYSEFNEEDAGASDGEDESMDSEYDYEDGSDGEGEDETMDAEYDYEGESQGEGEYSEEDEEYYEYDESAEN